MNQVIKGAALHQEMVSIRVPNAGFVTLPIAVDLDESDEQIASRLVAKGNYPIGTVLGLGSTKWVVLENRGVKQIPRLLRGEANRRDIDLDTTGPQVGQTYRPKDPRRKSSFTIKAVHADSVEGEDGRVVKLDRISRYSLVG